MLLSVMGLYQYDPTIFDVMELPEDLDAATLKAEILAECAELEVILPDPDVFKEVLNYWSKAHLSNWQHLMDVLERWNTIPSGIKMAHTPKRETWHPAPTVQARYQHSTAQRSRMRIIRKHPERIPARSQEGKPVILA